MTALPEKLELRLGVSLQAFFEKNSEKNGKSIDRSGRKMYNKEGTLERTEQTMEALLKILKELHPEVDFSMEQDLVGEGILDSMDIVTLITEINSEFDVRIPAEEILPENFCSPQALYELICRLDEA